MASSYLHSRFDCDNGALKPVTSDQSHAGS